MKSTITQSGLTSPGKDEICYVMLKNLGIVPGRYNRCIRKPGKDPSNPMNYRPIALMAHIAKIMERFAFYMESR